MIHQTAIVASNAVIGENVCIAPYVTIEEDVTIGSDCVIGSHSIIRGNTILGSFNKIHEFVVLGGDPQSVHYRGEKTSLEIGNKNVIREFVTISRGTATGGRITRVGNNNFIMAYSHIAHDCQIGNDCIFANAASLAGHVEVGDFAFLGGFTLSHQNCRIGRHSMTGLNTILRQDIAPFVTVNGDPAQSISINTIGLRRRGFDGLDISALKSVFRLYMKQRRTLEDTLKILDDLTKENEYVKEFVEFVNASQRGIIR